MLIQHFFGLTERYKCLNRHRNEQPTINPDLLFSSFSSSFFFAPFSVRVAGIGVARIFDWGGPKPSKIRLSSPKLRVNFGPKSEIRTIFPPKFRSSPKKKVFTEIKSDFSAEIGNSNDFSAQNQVISKKKKKKKVFTEIESGFSAETVSFTVTLLFNYCYVRNY